MFFYLHVFILKGNFVYHCHDEELSLSYHKQKVTVQMN